MSLEDLGNIGEFVAAVAVIVSLIYLAVGIRQNTSTARAQSFQQLSLSSVELLHAMGRSPQVSRVFTRGLRGYDDLSDEEREQLNCLLVGIFTFFENVHYQYLRGFLEEELWRRYRKQIQWYLSQSGVRRWWELMGSTWVSNLFHSFVHGQLADSECDRT